MRPLLDSFKPCVEGGSPCCGCDRGHTTAKILDEVAIGADANSDGVPVGNGPFLDDVVHRVSVARGEQGAIHVLRGLADVLDSIGRIREVLGEGTQLLGDSQRARLLGRQCRRQFAQRDVGRSIRGLTELRKDRGCKCVRCHTVSDPGGDDHRFSVNDLEVRVASGLFQRRKVFGDGRLENHAVEFGCDRASNNGETQRGGNRRRWDRRSNSRCVACDHDGHRRCHRWLRDAREGRLGLLIAHRWFGHTRGKPHRLGRDEIRRRDDSHRGGLVDLKSLLASSQGRVASLQDDAGFDCLSIHRRRDLGDRRGQLSLIHSHDGGYVL